MAKMTVDQELSILKSCYKNLLKLPEDAQPRAVEFLHDRFCVSDDLDEDIFGENPLPAETSPSMPVGGDLSTLENVPLSLGDQVKAVLPTEEAKTVTMGGSSAFMEVPSAPPEDAHPVGNGSDEIPTVEEKPTEPTASY